MQDKLGTFIRPQRAGLRLHLLELLGAIIPIPAATSSQRDCIAQHTSLPVICTPKNPTPRDRKGCIKEKMSQTNKAKNVKDFYHLHR